MKYTYSDIMKKLRGYNDLERRRKQLTYELEHYVDKVSGDDIIETMSFGNGMGERTKGGRPGDKTAKIAATYNEATTQANLRDKLELQEDLAYVKQEINRLTYYVGLLNDKQVNAVKIHYFKGNSIQQTAEKMDISMTSVKRILKSAIEELVMMYNMIISKQNPLK